MSPAPQGNLEVERYIGSYLISQRPHPNAKTSTPGNKRFQNQQHVKPKPSEPEKARNFNKYCYPQHQQREHHVGGAPRYSMAPPVPLECHQGYGTNPNHYSKHGGGAGWAGVPLISMTSGNHRRNKKTPSAANNNQAQRYPQKQSQQNGFVKGKEAEESVQQDSDRSPLTRLAIHTQGAPLIQAGRYNSSNRCRNNYNRGDSAPRVFRGESVRWEAAKDAKTPSNSHNKDQPCGNTDSLSVASDESSGNSENSLPRIIKPRKRRKKDRKPITGTTLGTSPSESQAIPREPDQNVESPTLKAFLPIRYEHNVSDTSENSASDLLSETRRITSVEETQSEDLIDPLTSADEFPLGNLLDDEEDNHSEVSSCAPTTLCQCRYCDPSGVIWDVDQRCYSPFLTPPSPTDGKLSFSNASFNPLTRSYNRQVAVVEPPAQPSSQSQYSIDADLGALLRRSWSDPSYKVPEYFQPAHPDKSGSQSSSPLGLQVSSEIVTSPNGHRDIEIKFYSSSAPLDSSRSKLGDRDQSDRCFVVEE